MFICMKCVVDDAKTIATATHDHGEKVQFLTLISLEYLVHFFIWPESCVYAICTSFKCFPNASLLSAWILRCILSFSISFGNFILRSCATSIAFIQERFVFGIIFVLFCFINSQCNWIPAFLFPEKSPLLRHAPPSSTLQLFPFSQLESHAASSHSQ